MPSALRARNHSSFVFIGLSVLFGLEGKELQADTFCPLTVRRYFCFVAADLETCFRSRFSLCFTVASFFGVILGHELTALRFAVEFAFLVVNTAGEVHPNHAFRLASAISFRKVLASPRRLWHSCPF